MLLSRGTAQRGRARKSTPSECTVQGVARSSGWKIRSAQGIAGIFESGSKAGIQPHHAHRLGWQLVRLKLAKSPVDMNVPGWRFYSPSGNRAGYFLDGQWQLGASRSLLKAMMLCWSTTWTINKGVNMSKMYNPPHPGETLREDILPALGLTVTQAAVQLNVTRAALSRVLNGRAAISPEMALRLEVWLCVENVGSADLWVGQQATYDLWKARQAGSPKVQRAPNIDDLVVA